MYLYVGQCKAEEHYHRKSRLHGNAYVVASTLAEHARNNDRALSTLLPFVALAFVASAQVLKFRNWETKPSEVLRHWAPFGYVQLCEGPAHQHQISQCTKLGVPKAHLVAARWLPSSLQVGSAEWRATRLSAFELGPRSRAALHCETVRI